MSKITFKTPAKTWRRALVGDALIIGAFFLALHYGNALLMTAFSFVLWPMTLVSLFLTFILVLSVFIPLDSEFSTKMMPIYRSHAHGNVFLLYHTATDILFIYLLLQSGRFWLPMLFAVKFVFSLLVILGFRARIEEATTTTEV